LRILSYAKKLIERFCKCLNIKEEPEKEIRMLFFQLLKDKKLNNMFFEKHIDQIIIFSIVSLTKSLQIDIDLSNLIKQYINF